MQKDALPAQLVALVASLEAQAGRYLILNGGRDFGEYVAEPRDCEDASQSF